jgi:hypothetical protein
VELEPPIESGYATRARLEGARRGDRRSDRLPKRARAQLRKRKRRLPRLIPSVPTRLLYGDHVEGRGKDFFAVACAHDLEGIVGKLASGR